MCTLNRNQECLGLLESINKSRDPRVELGMAIVHIVFIRHPPRTSWPPHKRSPRLYTAQSEGVPSYGL